MNLSFGNMTLELNVFNMYKQPHDNEDDDSENEEIDLIEPIIEEHAQDENSINFTEIYSVSSFESSKELNCELLPYALYLILCRATGGDDQSNFEDTL